MLNINSVLNEILKDIESKKDSIIIVDDQHIIDKITVVEFHLYDDYFQVTRGKGKPVSASSFSEDEQATIMKIKNLITDPMVTKDKQENYQKHITESRVRFSGWFENPEPVRDGVKEENNTEEYNRHQT